MTTTADRDSLMANRRNQFLEDVMDAAQGHLAEFLSPAEAAMVASSLTDHLADFWGGQLINIPKDYHWKLCKRDAEIYDAFNGHNYAELAKQHNMHERSLRKLLDRVKKRMRAATDTKTHDLFND